jgi:hypothetical protein
MTIPGGDAVLSSTWLSRALEGSRSWPHGSVRVDCAVRIGVDYGMSGRIHRVAVTTEYGGSRSLVVKQETANAVARELLFRSECAALIRGSVPDCYRGLVDGATERGALLLEDITPARQGNVLHGCTEEDAEAAVWALARLHGGSWQATDDGHPADLPRWGARAMQRDRWLDRVARAGERFPQIVTPALAARIDDLPAQVTRALNRLRNGPASWVQVDTHLDNVLWRPDGTAVLLDWCDAAIGPPVADLVRFLSEGVEAEQRSVLISAYVHELQSNGVEIALAEVTAALPLALLPLVQSAVGWAGHEDLPSHGRAAEVCESWLRTVVGWVVAARSAFEGRLNAI